MAEIQAIERQLNSNAYISKKKENLIIDTKRKNATDIWAYFNEIYCATTNHKIDGFIKCMHCPKVMKFNSKVGTGNALTHAAKHKNTSANSVANFFPKKRLNINGTDKIGVIDACIQLVAKDLRAFAVVNGEGMLDYSHTMWNLGAKYGNASRDDLAKILPHPTTVSNNLRKRAEQKKTSMSLLLQDALKRHPFIAITCDVWQDDFRRISYFGVTAHFYNADNTLCDQIIASKPLDFQRKKDHVYIRETIKTVIESNGLRFDSKEIVFVTDRGSNMKKGLNGFERINCFPHFVNNVVKQACKIDYIKSTLSACSDLVRFMKISGHNNELEKSLKSSVCTRFNTNLMMVASILENWGPLNSILAREHETSRLDGIDVSILEELKSFLMLFKHWSDYTERSKSPSLYSVWIAIDSIIKHCTIQDDDQHLTSLMKSKALCYIEKSFELNTLHRVATFLHPNFKNLRFATANLRQQTISESRELLQSYTSIDFNQTIAADSLADRRSSSSSISTVESELSCYLDEIVHQDEIEKYISLNIANEIQVDPAVWWNERKVDFPQLGRLAIAIHGVPASSTPTERSLSISGAIITERRSNINPSAIEDILIIRSGSQKFADNSIW